MSDLSYRGAATPSRWFLALVLVCVAGLIAAMMWRVVELKPQLDRVVEAADEPRGVPLPAGPRRFQDQR